MNIHTTTVTLQASCRFCMNLTEITIKVDVATDEVTKDIMDAIPEYMTNKFCKHCNRPMDVRHLEERARQSVLKLSKGT